jgi:DNA-binding SARP family transcriptional activator
MPSSRSLITRRLVPELEALVAQAPLRERRLDQLMLALYGSGGHAAALGALQRARETLSEQLGIDAGLGFPQVVARRARRGLQEPARPAPEVAQIDAAGGIGGRSRRSAWSSASPTSETWDATTSGPVVEDGA